jgi:predicted metal-dependent enzyme (double-stranded beta helix superfamily)
MMDLDAFVGDCYGALTETQPALAVKELVERAVSRPDEIDAALGEASTGGFHTLHHSPQLTVLQFIWPPGVQLFPHDHQMWAAIGIYHGAEGSVYYRQTPEGIQQSGRELLETGAAAALGRQTIHSVANPDRTHTAAIHVYGGDFFGAARRQWDAVTLEEAPYDIEAVRRVIDEAEALAAGDGS